MKYRSILFTGLFLLSTIAASQINSTAQSSRLLIADGSKGSQGIYQEPDTGIVYREDMNSVYQEPDTGY